MDFTKFDCVTAFILSYLTHRGEHKRKQDSMKTTKGSLITRGENYYCF
jgi:hypothetical protein